MKKIISLILVAVFACAMLAGCSKEINSGDRDVLYKGTVYKRCDEENYNLYFYEDNSYYIGDFLETYSYGQQLAWPVHALNGQENVLYTSYTTWLKPGYSLPDNFGEALLSAEYVISEGLDFLIMEDNYSETAIHLITFEGTVMLEDIVEAEVSEISEYVEYDRIRFRYQNYTDMASLYSICALDGKYYLNVCKPDGSDEFHEIKPEYVELLTSNIKAQ